MDNDLERALRHHVESSMTQADMADRIGLMFLISSPALALLLGLILYYGQREEFRYSGLRLSRRELWVIGLAVSLALSAAWWLSGLSWLVVLAATIAGLGIPVVIELLGVIFGWPKPLAPPYRLTKDQWTSLSTPRLKWAQFALLFATLVVTLLGAIIELPTPWEGGRVILQFALILITAGFAFKQHTQRNRMLDEVEARATRQALDG